MASQQSPTLAERARTLAAGHAQGAVQVAWVPEGVAVSHVADSAGVVTVFVSDGHELARVACLNSTTPASFTVTELGHLPTADRVTGSLRIDGSLTPVSPQQAAPALVALTKQRRLACTSQLGRLWPLQLAADTIQLSSSGVTVDVPIAEYKAAEPDPLAGDADVIVRHLNRDHPEVLRQIADAPAGVSVTATAIDRYGIAMDLHSAGQISSRRIPFQRAVADLTELSTEICHLRRCSANCTAPQRGVPIERKLQ